MASPTTGYSFIFNFAKQLTVGANIAGRVAPRATFFRRQRTLEPNFSYSQGQLRPGDQQNLDVHHNRMTSVVATPSWPRYAGCLQNEGPKYLVGGANWATLQLMVILNTDLGVQNLRLRLSGDDVSTEASARTDPQVPRTESAQPGRQSIEG